MISHINGIWTATEAVKDGAVVLEETPILVIPSNIPTGWKKLAKKISRIEADKKPEDMIDTMPPWNQVTLNEAIIKLLFAFDSAEDGVRSSILEMYDVVDESKDSPFESLIKKSKAVITKEGPKIGMSKKTIGSLHKAMRVLTTKVCVTTDGGAVLFRKLGSIQHSCTPNCMFIPRGNNVGQLVAVRDIEAGEKINCSHIPTNCLRASVETRQAWLRGIAGTRCRSDCCTRRYDLRRRVICVKCHPMGTREAELSSSDQSDICFAARNNETGSWKGLKCVIDMTESEAVDLAKEASLIKKIAILNETDVDLPRLIQFTRSAISEAIRVFGKGHFTYQQLLLLECGLALHSLCTHAGAAEPMRGMFRSWVKMLIDVVNFSVETELPFAGMDELVRILLAPETLQMSLRVMTGTKKDDAETLESLSTFADFVTRSCDGLVLIEGPESIHSQDGIKLKNWWTKKYKTWLLTPDVAAQSPATPTAVDEKSFVSTNAEDSVLEATVAWVSKPSLLAKLRVPIAVVSAAVLTGVLVFSLQRRYASSRK